MIPKKGAIVAIAYDFDGLLAGDLGTVKNVHYSNGTLDVEFAGVEHSFYPTEVRGVEHLQAGRFVCSAIEYKTVKVGDVGLIRGLYNHERGKNRIEVDFGHGIVVALKMDQTSKAPDVFGTVGNVVYSTIDWRSLKKGDRGTIAGLSSDREARDRVAVKFDSQLMPLNVKDSMISVVPPMPPNPAGLDSMGSLGDALPDLRTEDVTLISHTHGRERRAERNILRKELQAAIKYGTKERANPGRDGSQRWRFTYDGVVYITDETCRHEVTSWRIDGNDEDAVAPAEVELGGTGCHAVLIVDNSGSMRTADVPGYPTRATAVYECLVRDFIKEQVQVGAAKDVVVTLISMSNKATVVVKAHPLDNTLIPHIEKMKSRRPRSHGNYIPALDKALEVMTEDAPNRGSMLLLMFSDGAPSDQQCMECEHGIQVFEVDRKEDPKMGHKSKASGWFCRKNLHAKVKKECLDRVKRIGQVFGRDRVVSRMIGFGPPKEDFELLSEMASVLPRGEFQKLGLNASNLKTAFSSLSSSMTDLRTAGGSSMLTPRLDKVVDKNQKIDSSKKEIHAWEGWLIYSHEDFLGKFQMKVEGGSYKPRKLALDHGATGLAFVSQPFQEGAERLVYRCTEIEIPERFVESWLRNAATYDDLKAHRASHRLRLVAKEAKMKENLNKGREFHETFARIQLEAAELATKFSERLPPPSPNMWKLAFVPTFLYCCKDPLYTNERCWVLAEPELDGKWTKWNNNAGAVRATQAKSQSTQINQGTIQSLGFGMALIEESDEDDEDEDFLGPIEVDHVPQAFSHFSYESSGGKCLVCDLQGVWNQDDGFLLTDPVVHHVSRSGKKHKNGATDKGLDGVKKFFETHECNALCKKMGLTPRTQFTLIKRGWMKE